MKYSGFAWVVLLIGLLVAGHVCGRVIFKLLPIAAADIQVFTGPDQVKGARLVGRSSYHFPVDFEDADQFKYQMEHIWSFARDFAHRRGGNIALISLVPQNAPALLQTLFPTRMRHSAKKVVQTSQYDGFQVTIKAYKR